MLGGIFIYQMIQSNSESESYCVRLTRDIHSRWWDGWHSTSNDLHRVKVKMMNEGSLFQNGPQGRNTHVDTEDVGGGWVSNPTVNHRAQTLTELCRTNTDYWCVCAHLGYFITSKLSHFCYQSIDARMLWFQRLLWWRFVRQARSVAREPLARIKLGG